MPQHNGIKSASHHVGVWKRSNKALSMKDIAKTGFHPIPAGEEWRVEVINELVRIRDGSMTLIGWNLDEIQEMLGGGYVCVYMYVYARVCCVCVSVFFGGRGGGGGGVSVRMYYYMKKYLADIMNIVYEYQFLVNSMLSALIYLFV